MVEYWCKNEIYLRTMPLIWSPHSKSLIHTSSLHLNKGVGLVTHCWCPCFKSLERGFERFNFQLLVWIKDIKCSMNLRWWTVVNDATCQENHFALKKCWCNTHKHVLQQKRLLCLIFIEMFTRFMLISITSARKHLNPACNIFVSPPQSSIDNVHFINSKVSWSWWDHKAFNNCMCWFLPKMSLLSLMLGRCLLVVEKL